MSGAQVFLETPQNSCVLMRSIKRYGAPGFHQKKPSILVVVKWKSGNPSPRRKSFIGVGSKPALVIFYFFISTVKKWRWSTYWLITRVLYGTIHTVIAAAAKRRIRSVTVSKLKWNRCETAAWMDWQRCVMRVYYGHTYSPLMVTHFFVFSSEWLREWCGEKMAEGITQVYYGYALQ